MMDIPAMVEAFAGTAVGTPTATRTSRGHMCVDRFHQRGKQDSPEHQCADSQQRKQQEQQLQTRHQCTSPPVHFSTCSRTLPGTRSLLVRWVLSSGTIVDDVLTAWAQRLASEQSAESKLHSFVIENVKEVLEAFEDEADKAEIYAVLEARPGEHLQELNDSERVYLALIAKDPKEVGKLLDKSWTDISLDPQENNLDDDFRSFVNHWMKHLYLVYRTRNYQLPTTESESWFLNMLWLRRRITVHGQPRLLGDTLKIAKFAKGMVDVIPTKAPDYQLVSYCFRISAGSIHLYTFQQRSGRFDQLFYETSVTFPPRWDALTAEDITAVIGQVISLRKEPVSCNNKLATWKKGQKAAKESIKPVIPTLPTPASMSKNCPASV
ncbi:hypothetical protein EC957_010180 [Mortierella hygrophila]|uniref:Uncharacterized protein n=1 Tax=Mortierella hygrophila TaxID=979708 RepID=A0A9P6K464_9FUNG|nr:hypothetical protein EC957_010180 [Mortierella hygrophila]